MGLTILAVGTSVPDAMSSILVAKLGKGIISTAFCQSGQEGMVLHVFAFDPSHQFKSTPTHTQNRIEC